MHTRLAAFGLAGTFLAGCAGGSPGAGMLPGGQSAGTQAASAAHRKSGIVLRIAIPHKPHHAGRRPQYLSWATQSMKLIVTGPTNVAEIVNLTPTSTGCTSTLTSTLCVLSVALAPGTGYVATVTTYDQTGANGNELSTAQNIGFNVVAGTSNNVNLTLSGVPAKILVLPGGPTASTDAYGGVDVIGTGASKLLAEALDADNNVILGAGSPTFSVSQVAGALTLTIVQPTTTKPNAFSVRPPSAYSASTATIEVKASYQGQPTDGCAQSGAVCSASLPVRMQTVAALASATGVEVFQPSTGLVLTTISAPGMVNDVAFDASANLYVSNCGTNCSSTGSDAILKYAPPYTGSPVSITSGVTHPEGIAFDGNGNLYVANDVVLAGGGQDTIAIYSPPFTAASAPSKTWTNTVNQPESIAIDPANDVFISELTGNSGNGQVIGFSSAYTTGPPTYGPITSGVSLSGSGVQSIALDASANLYVASPTANHVTKYYGYNSVGGGAVPYTCTTNCNNGISSNPKTVTACGGCTGYAPIAVTTLATSGNAPQGYGLFVADKQNNAVYQYSNSTSTPGYTRAITSHVAKPLGLVLDSSSNLFVANNTGNSLTEYNGSASYAYLSTLVSGFSAPIAAALAP